MSNISSTPKTILQVGIMTAIYNQKDQCPEASDPKTQVLLAPKSIETFNRVSRFQRQHKPNCLSKGETKPLLLG